MKLLFVFIILSLSNCGPSPMAIWLEEYQALLKQGIHFFATDPYSVEMQQVQSQISEKEAEVDGLLRSSSMQEQMNFLSKYYDMRVNFYYSVQ
ncbi:MAG: hypothetical protein KFW21_03505 [Spirochaetota bacterium]|nr:hypothetical protein [Spirochaetota bacterium]